MNKMKLSYLEEGMKAVVKEINNTGSIRRRLQDVGLIEGANVQCLHVSPAGNPKAYGILGAVIAIRNEDAWMIEVQVDEGGVEFGEKDCVCRESECW